MKKQRRVTANNGQLDIFKDTPIPSWVKELQTILIAFFGQETRRYFDYKNICKSYLDARNEYFAEKVLREKNPEYQPVAWETLMKNHIAKNFDEEEWLRFTGKYGKKKLKQILRDCFGFKATT